jgi:ATP synthase protein I
VVNGRRAALLIVISQTVATLLIAAGFLALSSEIAARSALIGGGISTVATLIIAVATFREVVGNDSRRMLINLYRGEAAKLGLTVLMLIVSFKLIGVQALPFFVAYIATLFVHWISLIGSRVS